MSPHDDTRADDIAAYALGALSELEATALERHVMSCEECAAELRRLRPTADALALAVEPRPAPDTLKARLMDVVRAEAGPEGVLSAEASAAGVSSAEASAAGVSSAGAGPEGVPRGEGHGAGPASAEVGVPSRRGAERPSIFERLLPRRPAFAGAAALAASAALVAAGFAANEITADEDSRTIDAQVDGARLTGASARLDAEGDLAVLRTSGLPRLSDGRVYVVWVDHGRGPVYASSFNVRPDGSGEAAVADASAVRTVMVTREASTAVREPSERPVITATLQS